MGAIYCGPYADTIGYDDHEGYAARILPDGTHTATLTYQTRRPPPHRRSQPGVPHVEEHPVDRLHLEDNVIVEDISDTARYRHRGLRSTGGQ